VNVFLLIDNYDSFTYNLYHLIRQVTGEEIEVTRNNKTTIKEIQNKNYKGIFISPGPCTPIEAGIVLDVISNLHKTTPMFGVCLGMQAMVHSFGGKIIEAKTPMHGKVSVVEHLENSHIFENIPTEFHATRYHSLIAEKSSFPKDLTITARSADDKHIMAISHKEYNIHGVQFHPESISSEYGAEMIHNFIKTI
jgi:anthranilate synthase component II